MAITELKETPGYTSIEPPVEKRDEGSLAASQNTGDVSPPASAGTVAPQVSSVVPGEAVRDTAQVLTPDTAQDTGVTNALSDALGGILDAVAPEPNIPEPMDLNIGLEPAPVSTMDEPVQPRVGQGLFQQIAPAEYSQSAMTFSDALDTGVVNDRGYESVVFPKRAKSEFTQLTGGSVDLPSAGTRAVAASSQPTNTILDVANAYFGYDERDSKQALALSEFFKKAGGLNLDPSTTAWCAGFANAVLGEAGFGGTGKLNARSFLNYGQAVESPQVGDIVVFSRGDPKGWQGHVGFIAGINKDGTLQVLGGNQSTSESRGRGVSVNISTFSTDKVLGYRRPVPLAS